MTDYKLVPVDTLKAIHRDLDACQKVIWLAGEFDPAYYKDAQARLQEIDGLLAAPDVQMPYVLARLKQIWLLLDGQGQLNGFSWGERPGDCPQFWWRKELRAAVEPVLAAAPDHITGTGKKVALDAHER